MTTKEILKELKSLGDEKRKQQNIKRGDAENQFGVKYGDIRKIAKKIKTNHKLAMQLWKTEIVEARLLSVLTMDVNSLTAKELESLVKSMNSKYVSDWLNSYVIKLHPNNEKLRLKWLKTKNNMLLRAGWNLTCIKIRKGADGLDLDNILTTLEKEMPKANELAQWTMNFTLAEIGINYPKFRKRTIEIGEKIGLYKDYPMVKGCISPYVPIWVNEMVSRQK